MTKDEADIIAAWAQRQAPADSVSVERVKDAGGKTVRYAVTGPGLRIEFAWQYLELRLMGLAQVIAQGQRPASASALVAPSGEALLG